MLNQSYPIAGLEIGTAKICVAIGQLDAAGTLEVLGLGQAASRGVRKSEIVSPELAAEDVRAAVFEAEQALPPTGLANCPRASIFLCGGGARIPGINQLAENIFQMPTALGHVRPSGGLTPAMDQPEFATAIGLLRYGSTIKCPFSEPLQLPPPSDSATIGPKPIASLGRFAKCKPTIHNGEDLDVLTSLRRSRPRN
jgi:cell division ATPase FtsA